jgi:hypothetical protein
MRFSLLVLYIIFLQALLSACSTDNNKEYNLEVSVSPVNAGTVTPETGYFNDGDSLTITANPNEHWVFDRWKGNITVSENPAKLEVHQDLDITAMFTERTYPLNLEIQGEGSVSEQIIQQKTNEYPNETLVELTATPSEGWHFLEWKGDLTGTEPVQEIKISRETDVTAKFTLDKVKTFGGSLGDEGWSIASTSDGGMVITGRSASNDEDFAGLSRGEYFSFVLKLSGSGEKGWIRTFYGSEHYERASSITQTQDGGYIFTGQTFPDDSESENIGQGEVYITKLNSTGDTQWSKILYGNNSDFSRQVVETSGGDFIVVGHTSSNTGAYQNSYNGVIAGFILKLSARGDLKWVRKYGGSEMDYIHSATLSGDGGIVVTGSTESKDGDFQNTKKSVDNIFAMKVSTDGDILWTNIFGRDSENYSSPTSAVSIATSSDGGFILTGNTTAYDGDFEGIDNGFIKPFVIKLNSAGQKEWVTVYEGDYSIIRPSQVVETQDNGIVVTGLSNSNTEIYHPQIDFESRIFALKLTSSGSVNWFKTFNGSEDDYGFALTSTNQNSVIITGRSSSNDDIFSGLNKGESDIFILQVNESGELISFE